MICRKSIRYRISLFAWATVGLATLLFLGFVLWREKQACFDLMDCRAGLMTASIQAEINGPLGTDDFVSVTDRCLNILQTSPQMRYVVVTRRDGLSFIHTPGYARQADLRGIWCPKDLIRPSGRILSSNMVEGKVYHYTAPLPCYGQQWGWIHLGLPVDNLHAGVKAAITQASWLGFLCLVVTFLIARSFARRLTQPLLSLNHCTRQFADGDLSARAAISSGDEVEALANSFNHMAEDLGTSQRELLLAQEHNTNIMRSMIDALVVVDPDMKIQTVNRATCEMLEYDEDELLGTHISTLFDKHEFKGNELRSLIERSPVQNHEMAYKTKSGRLVPILFSGAVMRDSAFNYQGIVCIAKDITDIQQARRCQQQSEARFRALVETSHNLIWQCDRQYRLTYLNPAWESTYGYDLSKMINRSMADFMAPKRATADLRLLQRCMEGGIISRYETVHLSKSGREIQLMINAVPLRDEDGNIIGAQGTAYDITTRKQAEADHARLEKQLRQTLKMEAIGQLAGGVAHDFNNLLQAITAHVYVMKESVGEDAPVYGELEEVKKAAERAASLTRQLLAFSRQQVMQLRPLHLNDAVTNMTKMLRRLIGENIDLGFIPGNKLPLITADQQQVEQVLMNLCINARDAMPAGGRITISTEKVVLNHAFCERNSWAKEGKFVMLTVSDNGKGIPEEIQGRIFDPFFTTKEVGKGTGLGLSTVYGIVQQHEGLLHLDSEIGRGTDFHIYFPVNNGSDIQPHECCTDMIVGGNETILVAEDEEFVRKPLLQILKSAGYSIFTACDGKEAVSIFNANADKISLALLDIVMPKMSGDEVYKQVKKINPDIRVLFSSGYNPSEVAADFINTEGLNLISKPYNPRELLSTIRKILDNGQIAAN